ncbi:hypothetical protein GGI12_004498 [Dipsacomyces acuminosporus]|nr:hypothetical protein GGI12_004498 [Dipsacomyces acuminosporus]
MAAFVAASCLDYDKAGQVDNSTKYQIMIDRNSIAPVALYSIDRIHVHPDYNSTTMANNIAVVEFNTNGTASSWKNTIGTDSKKAWSTAIYAGRFINNLPKMSWSTPQVVEHSEVNKDCSKMSGLFDYNQDDFLCGNWTVSPKQNADACQIPYGSVYSVCNKKLAVAGLYSHTVSFGSDICKSDRQWSYYLLLANYVAFANDVMKTRKVDTLTTAPEYSPNTNPSYQMSVLIPNNVKGTTIVSGDMFAGNSRLQPFQTPGGKAPTETATPDASAVTPTQAADLPSSSSSSSSKLSKGQAVGVAVGVSVAALIASAVLYFLFKRRKARRGVVGRRHGRARDSTAENLARELGGASIRHTIVRDTLPPQSPLQSPPLPRFSCPPPAYTEVELADMDADGAPKPSNS